MLRKIAIVCVLTVSALAVAGPAQAQLNHYHVEYRQVQWKERVFVNHEQAHEFEEQLLAQGFQTVLDHHGSHFHVRYRMFNWRLYRTVHSHSYAHELQDMLESRGLQARVVHH